MHQIDPITTSDPRSCLPVSINNCVKNDNEKCLVCDSTFKPSGNGTSCISISSPIPNCSIHNTNSECVQCETPFIYDPVSKACLIEETMEKFLD